MTDLLQRKERPDRDVQYSSALTADAKPVRPRIALYVLRSMSGWFCFTMVVLVLGAALVELASWVIWSGHPITRQAELENQIASPVYTGAPWAREFWQEEFSRRKKPTIYVPFRLWGVTSWHSKYINNDE